MEFFLSSDIHQGDELFSVQSRGKECAFMSLSAILTAQNIPLIDWSKTTFNNVLLQGDTIEDATRLFYSNEQVANYNHE